MSKLALLGGEKTVNKGVEDFFVETVPKEAYSVVKGLMDRGEISLSPIVKSFEKKFADYIGTKYGLCEVNGTTAIQAGLFAVGVGAGDEVIVPSYTFWATVGPVVACNAIPVFADVDPESFLLTADTIRKCITPKTKAILLVHVWGNPCDMDEIMELAKEHNLKVVEDCSHAHGALYKNKKVGSIGDVGCFSMQGSKILAAGEGGVLVTNNREYFERAVALGHYERLSGLESDSEYRQYSLTGFGFKHRINPFAIAIADSALDRLDKYNKIRNDYGAYLNELISDIDCIIPQKVYEGAERVFAYHYVRYLPERFGNINIYTILEALAAEGVTCGTCGYGMLHKAPLYTNRKMCAMTCPCYGKEYTPTAMLPVSEKLAHSSFLIAPRFEMAEKTDIEEYAAAYHKVFENFDALLKYEKEAGPTRGEIENTGRSYNWFKPITK